MSAISSTVGAAVDEMSDSEGTVGGEGALIEGRGRSNDASSKGC